MHHVAASAGRLVSRLTAALGLLTLLVGVPVWLAWAIGWPLPTTVPTSWDGWQHLLTSPIPDTAILHLLTIAGWLLWAAFTRATWVEAKAAWRGVHAPPAGSLTFHPLRALASFLIVTIAAGTMATATSTAAQPAIAAPTGTSTYSSSILMAVPDSTTDASGAPRNTTVVGVQHGARAPLLPAGPAVLVVNGCLHLYTVVEDDSLWTIAENCLGDGQRWKEIWDLNEGRFWPTVSGYKHFTDPDLIYPRWTLTLPIGASPPQGSPQVEPPAPVTPPASPSTTPTTPAPGTSMAAPAVTPSTSPATDTPGPGLAPPTGSVASPSPTNPTATPTTAPASTPTQTPTPSGLESVVPADADGVSLPGGGWVPWALAAAISAAATMVWLQRRRRYVPGAGDDLTDLPAPVTQLQRGVARNADLPTPADEIEKAAAVPPMEKLPPGGIGLVGDGAAAAARAGLIAVLASGGPRNPHERGEVVIDAATLTTLIGSDAVTLGRWPRLHIADDLDDALTIIEARLVHRGRVLDQHSLTDLDTLLAVAPDEEALPPILLVCETPPAGSRMRAKVSLGLGTALQVSALMLGEWDYGPTVDVTADGHTRVVGGAADNNLPDRLGVLEPDAAVRTLLTLREAHTGQPPAVTTPTAPPIPIPLAAPPAAPDQPPPDPPNLAAQTDVADAATEPMDTPGKARLRVLGSPGIDDVTAPGKTLRGKALELAVYLACHPDGAATRQIGEYLAPDYRVKQADQQVHTNASNLRHVFTRAAGERPNAYVIKNVHESVSRYRLDPATVEVDLWQLRSLMHAATLASGDKRRDLLRQACDLYTAPLADGCKYEWIGPHRETVRRWGTEAHLHHADALLDTDPQAASDLLDKAIALDRYNENLYVHAMQARHTLHDADGIRILIRALTKALADIDIEPTEQTIAIAAQLRTSLDDR